MVSLRGDERRSNGFDRCLLVRTEQLGLTRVRSSVLLQQLLTLGSRSLDGPVGYAGAGGAPRLK
jgi:hypothetical protein